MDTTFIHRVQRGMAFLDGTDPRWKPRTIYALTHTPDKRLYAPLVALGGLLGLGVLVRAYGPEWTVRMGFYADPRGTWGPPIGIVQLDMTWRRLLVNGGK